jgi:hypothetical protein
MIAKQPIVTQRVRKVPKQFSWVDQRLVRESRIMQCSVAGAALYLFLVIVSDAKGLSFYNDGSIGRYLGMDAAQIRSARDNLLAADLIAYKRPLYQVLSLMDEQPRSCLPGPLSFGDIMKKAMEGRK